MKINKLFHWLYGALMCLPLLGVLFTSLYVVFNPNAKDSYFGETINQEEIEYVSFNNLEVSEKYYYESSLLPRNNEVITTNLYVTDFVGLSDNLSTYTGAISYITFISRNSDYTSLRFFNNNNVSVKEIYMNGSSACNFSFVLRLTNTNTYFNSLDLFYQYEYVDFSFLDKVFTYAVNDINNNSLYNWAQDSFLVAPIAFVTGLFGLTQTSPVVTLLSYWLTISIVWLVFDLIMYIPLLVHRWLDKGVLS